MTRTDQSTQSAADVAGHILERADSDIAFIPRLMGESLYILTDHFARLIEQALSAAGIQFGDHPLLRPFIDLHSRELTDYVLNGVALRHQFGIEAIERLGGDPSHLLRVDLWDSLNTLIEDAQRHFLNEPHGLSALMKKIQAIESPVPTAPRTTSEY